MLNTATEVDNIASSLGGEICQNKSKNNAKRCKKYFR